MPKTVTVDILNNAFPMIRVEEGSSVVWRNLDPYPHTVETEPKAEVYFNAGPLHTGGTTSPVQFRRAGKWPYLCRFHPDMTGIVEVVAAGSMGGSGKEPHAGHGEEHGGGADHGHHQLQHYHGFVTGGRSADRLFMTHTPVIADPRHRFQIIMRGSLVKPEHIEAYNAFRAGSFGDGQIQIFHDHLSLPGIADGTVKELPAAEVNYLAGASLEPVAGLESNVPVRIDQVLHFHTFEPDRDYPEGLEYIVYGDDDDVFIDHHITRAPNFHSVAKLAATPAFWKKRQSATMQILIPTKKIIDVQPKYLPRVAFVDNAFHLVWLPPSGAFPGQAQDPLIVRAGGQDKPVYECVVEDGSHAEIQIGRFIYFDIRLLNNRVVIT